MVSTSIYSESDNFDLSVQLLGLYNLAAEGGRSTQFCKNIPAQVAVQHLRDHYRLASAEREPCRQLHGANMLAA